MKCKDPIVGKNIELRTSQNTYLSISGIEVWTGATVVDGGVPNTIEVCSGKNCAGYRGY